MAATSEQRREQVRAAGRRYYERHKAQEQERKRADYWAAREYHLAHKRRRRQGPEGARVRALNAIWMRGYRRRQAAIMAADVAAIEREIDRREGRRRRGEDIAAGVERAMVVRVDAEGMPYLSEVGRLTALAYRPRWYRALKAWYAANKTPAATVAARQAARGPVPDIEPEPIPPPHYVRTIVARLRAKRKDEAR